MLTEFGKECRKIRIDAGEFLADMAAKLGVAASFLSAVENGKKNVPRDWCEKIAKYYSLSEAEYSRITQAAADSLTQVKIAMQDLNKPEKDLVLSFARSFDKLDSKDRDEIFKILQNGTRGE